MTEDEQLLAEYSKEICGKYYNPNENMTEAEKLLADYNEEVSQSEKWTADFTMETLIRQSREYRKQNKEDGEKYRFGYKEGYDNGYKMGVSNAAENTIMLEDLRKMTFQEIANLIGEEND